MSSPPSIDVFVEETKASIHRLQIRNESGKDSTTHTVSLFEPDADDRGDDLLFAEINADLNGEVEYPSADQSERSAFKIRLSNGESTLREISFEHGRGVHVNVSVDIEQLCFERILDRLKQLLPVDAVLFHQVVGYGMNPIYKRLGFTIKPHVFPDEFIHPQFWFVKNATLALADWRLQVSNKRHLEEEVDRLPSEVTKAKPDSA